MTAMTNVYAKVDNDGGTLSVVVDGRTTIHRVPREIVDAIISSGDAIEELTRVALQARDSLLVSWHPGDRIIGYELANVLAKFGVIP